MGGVLKPDGTTYSNAEIQKILLGARDIVGQTYIRDMENRIEHVRSIANSCPSSVFIPENNNVKKEINMKPFSKFTSLDFRYLSEQGIPIVMMIEHRYNCEPAEVLALIKEHKICNIIIYYLLYKYFRYGMYWESVSKAHDMKELRKKTWAHKLRFKK